MPPPAQLPDSSREQPEEIAASRFFWLIGVFLTGLLLVVGLKAFFSHLQDELGVRSGNERARLFIGEEIVRSIQAIEKDVYHMTWLTGDAAQARAEQAIRDHVAKLEHDLGVPVADVNYLHHLAPQRKSAERLFVCVPGDDDASM